MTWYDHDTLLRFQIQRKVDSIPRIRTLAAIWLEEDSTSDPFAVVNVARLRRLPQQWTRPVR